jgi:hypothetical protein
VLIFSIFIYLFSLPPASSISPKDQEWEDDWLPLLVTFTVIIMGTTMLPIKELLTDIHHISEEARILYCTILKVASKNV